MGGWGPLMVSTPGCHTSDCSGALGNHLPSLLPSPVSWGLPCCHAFPEQL